jgi:hypothetical protein
MENFILDKSDEEEEMERASYEYLNNGRYLQVIGLMINLEDRSNDSPLLFY